MDAESFKNVLTQAVSDWGRVSEIRIRAGRPVFLSEAGTERELPATADLGLIREILEICSGHSLYAFEEEIRQGFLTIRGGHRIGLAGRAVAEAGRELGACLSGCRGAGGGGSSGGAGGFAGETGGGSGYGYGGGGTGNGIRTIRDISSLNIRLAHEIKGCAEGLLPQLFDPDGELYSTLLISPPGAGKTTMLRDLVRLLSDGTAGHAGVSVAVVDERSELGACFHGVPQCDLGKRTDIMDACPKAAGLVMMVRSMAPRVLAVDEAGSAADFEALQYAATCGCRLLATVHGSSVEDIRRKPVLESMFRARLFARYVVLTGKPEPGTVAGIYAEDGEKIAGAGERIERTGRKIEDERETMTERG